MPARSPLAAAIRGDQQGPYGDGRYFASAPVGGSPWRVVLTTTKDDLYESVNGSQRTIPWLIFAAFALVAGAGLLLFRRVLVSNAKLQRAELNRMHALEINDNVVQRLVVAKLALERGATETSQEKLAETLQETQQLVTSLLEEKEIAPGVLRRGAAAQTAEPRAQETGGARMTANGKIGVFLVDDVVELRTLVRLSLEEDPDIEVVGEAANGREGVQGVARRSPTSCSSTSRCPTWTAWRPSR